MRDLFRFSHFSAYGLPGEVIQALLHIPVTDMPAPEARPQHRCVHSARQYGIHADTIRRKLNRHGAGQRKKSPLRSSVRGDIG